MRSAPESDALLKTLLGFTAAWLAELRRIHPLDSHSLPTTSQRVAVNGPASLLRLGGNKTRQSEGDGYKWASHA
jgi:hypothetical protein